MDQKRFSMASGPCGVTKYEREPRWFPLIARAASPQALLSFRYTVGTCLSSHSMRRLGDPRDKVAAGMNPAAKAALVNLTRLGRLNYEREPRWFPLIARAA